VRIDKMSDDLYSELETINAAIDHLRTDVLSEMQETLESTTDLCKATETKVETLEGIVTDTDSHILNDLWPALENCKSYMEELKERDYERSLKRPAKERERKANKAREDALLVEVGLLKRKQREYEEHIEHATKRQAILEKHLRFIARYVDMRSETHDLESALTTDLDVLQEAVESIDED
jgi:hypothetical protein